MVEEYSRSINDKAFKKLLYGSMLTCFIQMLLFILVFIMIIWLWIEVNWFISLGFWIVFAVFYRSRWSPKKVLLSHVVNLIPQPDTERYQALVDEDIHYYQKALTLIENINSTEWADNMYRLAIAYYNRQHGDRAENIEKSVQAYLATLSIRTQDKMPIEWAITMVNLGRSYQLRIHGDRAQNIENAIDAYQQALTVMTQTAMPIEWATAMVNLGIAYQSRIYGDRAQNIEDAINAYQQALVNFKSSAERIEWATTMANLGNAYQSRIHGDRAQNIEDAIDAYQQVLTVFTPDITRINWATTMMNLGNAYQSRIHGDRVKDIENSIISYTQSLTVFTRFAMPIDNYRTLENLSNLYYDEQRWSETHQTCLAAIAVGKDIFAVAVGDAGRMDAIKQTGSLFTRTAYSALQLGQYGDALTQLEAGKARLLAEALSLDDTNLTQLDDEELLQLQALRDTIKELEYEARLYINTPTPHNSLAISADLGEARATLRELIEAFRAKYPDFIPEGLALDDLLALIPPDGALVAPLFTPQGSAVFMVPGGVCEVTAEHVLLLDDFKFDDLRAITRETEDKPGWLSYYINYRFNGADGQTLVDGIDDVTRRLWDAFVGQIHERLQALGVQRVLLMPQGDTNLVPLHVAWREVEGVRRYFMDDYTVTYTLSMVTLATARRKSTQGEGALVIGVSEYPTMGNLLNTKAEAEGVATLLGESTLLDGAASVEAVREGVKGKAFVHLACHGGFGWGGNVFASTLYLGDEAPLPLPEIMATLDLNAARLVVLSACETGIVDVDNVPDEFVGLAAGFMQAGASAVVSSLWTVDDRSTALLMERMYNNMRDEANPMEPAQALREAQFWLRDATVRDIGAYYQRYLIPRMSQSEAGQAFVEIMMRAAPEDKPYSHPYYWAAFVYSGM